MTSPSTGNNPPAAGPLRFLLFDVLGTLVDETRSIRAEVEAAVAAAGDDHNAGRLLADEWGRRHEALVDEIANGRAPWRSNVALRRAALDDAVAATGLGHLAADVLDDLASVGFRMRLWADSSAALRAMARSFTVVALSNGTMAELAHLSRAGDLLWHAVLSGELVEAYKPDPAIYRLALEMLGLDPAQTMMVAAHPWDLRAAATHGMRTACVSRPGAAAPSNRDRFDVYADDLHHLARQLVDLRA